MSWKLFWLVIGLLTFDIASNVIMVSAQSEDAVEGEDDEGTVEDDAGDKPDAVVGKDLDEEEEVSVIGPSPDAETYVLFTLPANSKDLLAGKLTKFLVGIHNKGSEFDFFVESLEATLRYPLDYTFVIRNYTASKIMRNVKIGQEATFDYAMIPPEDLAGRSFGLNVNLHYRDSNGTQFQSAVFNETINIVEDESHFNPETGFLYVFFGCFIVLLLVLGQQFLQKMRRKHGIMKKPAAPVEMGTTTNSDVDWEWIPKEYLASKSPKSNKSSPRQRKGKKSTESSD